MASQDKRCLYEVLGLKLDCTADEIRSAYRKLALQRHPDKLVQSGVSEADATASFQELVNAYEVLSDPRERTWYDSHRSQILFSSSSSSSTSNSNSNVVPNLFSFFSNSVFSGYADTGKGFYRVYADIFDKIFGIELNFAKKMGLGLGSVKEAPVMGNLDSPYTQVTAFYNYWLGFATVMDFCWADQYDVMAGVNRKSRRVMEDENKKVRKKAKREYNETVRGLAEFAKKRDKRVIDMQVRRSEEMERKRKEELERKKQLEREKLQKAKAYEEPDWAKVDEDEIENGLIEEEEDEKKNDQKELYCVVCSKKFKSEKQWKNHEQSKKHKEKVAELKAAFGDEEEESEEEEVEEESEEEEASGGNGGVDESGFVSANDEIDELEEQVHSKFKILEQQSVDEKEEENFGDVDNGGGSNGVAVSLGSDADESMVSSNKNEGNTASVHQPKFKGNASAPKVVDDGDDSDEMDMAYNKRKTRRNKGAKKDRRKRTNEEAAKADVAETNGQVEGGDHESDEESSHSFVHSEINGGEDDPLNRNHRKGSKQSVDNKGTGKKDTNTKSKHSSKLRKQKATSKNSSNVCVTCGEDFESRNQLHKHLGDTGHAKLKSR